MRHRFPTLRAFLLATVRNPKQWLRFSHSPGGAANYLGVSRQRITQLIDADQLDAVSTADGYVLLDFDQVERRRQRLRALDAGKRSA